ncbi:MAG: ATP-binding cassette domain-containing protein [Micropruina sp.]
MNGLEVTGAEVRYDDVLAVAGVDLAVGPGEIVALLGASGSGKSSLLRGIAGLEPLVSGRVRWNAEDVTRVPVHARGFGMMFQDGQLFHHLSVAGNIAYGLHSRPKPHRRERVAELLGLVGLAGYGGRRVSELSGGQAQQVALARSLARVPGCCCSTSRCRRSTATCGNTWWGCSATCCGPPAAPPSTSPTTRTRRSRWPTGSA